MLIDFTPVRSGEVKYTEFSRQFTVEDLRAATNASIDFFLHELEDAEDAQISHIPDDPEANDPHALPGEEKLGWGLGHLIAHVTATSEEWAVYSSILARGIAYPADPRLRYETYWREITTKAQAVQRLEESRRIRLGYLDTWPDAPNYNVYRELSPRFVERFGEMNCAACFLFGLSHETGHRDQYLDAAQQARAVVVSGD